MKEDLKNELLATLLENGQLETTPDGDGEYTCHGNVNCRPGCSGAKICDEYARINETGVPFWTEDELGDLKEEYVEQFI